MSPDLTVRSIPVHQKMTINNDSHGKETDCKIWSFRSATHVGALAHVKLLKHTSNHKSNSVFMQIIYYKSDKKARCIIACAWTQQLPVGGIFH